LLPGITRETVLSLASDAGIPIREEPLPREMLYVADEVFLSGTASEITPIRSVDKITVGAGKPGPVTKELQRLFMSTVRGESADPRGWLTYVRAERADARSLGGRASAAKG
jgi:branched-chain amino acid aminotransferase